MLYGAFRDGQLAGSTSSRDAADELCSSLKRQHPGSVVFWMTGKTLPNELPESAWKPGPRVLIHPGPDSRAGDRREERDRSGYHTRRARARREQPPDLFAPLEGS